MRHFQLAFAYARPRGVMGEMDQGTKEAEGAAAKEAEEEETFSRADPHPNPTLPSNSLTFTHPHCNPTGGKGREICVVREAKGRDHERG